MATATLCDIWKPLHGLLNPSFVTSQSVEYSGDIVLWSSLKFRRAREMTQVKLADTLGVDQGEVSNIEHRTDIHISTLAEYVERYTVGEWIAQFSMALQH